jgi:hypothetical protein
MLVRLFVVRVLVFRVRLRRDQVVTCFDSITFFVG